MTLSCASFSAYNEKQNIYRPPAISISATLEEDRYMFDVLLIPKLKIGLDMAKARRRRYS